MNTEKLYISRCLQLARLGAYYVAPNPMVGAVLVCDNRILGEGWHEQYGGAHAEPNCIRHAEEAHPEGIDYKHSTLYVSLEPCSHYGKTPPCAELIIRKGIGRVVVGVLDPNPQVAGRGVKMMREAGIEVLVGVMEQECRELNKRFFCLQENHRPYVVLKWAETADGYIDRLRGDEAKGEEHPKTPRAFSGTPQRREESTPLVISTPLMKHLVHQQRAENMAIMVGTRTALLDNPRLLNTRWSGRNPVRITLDRHGVLPQDSRIFSPEAPTIVYRENTDWQFILQDLAQRNIHSVLVEGGSTLLQYILDSGIYDEVHIEVGNQQIGDGVKAPHYVRSTQPMIVDGHRVYIEER